MAAAFFGRLHPVLRDRSRPASFDALSAVQITIGRCQRTGRPSNRLAVGLFTAPDGRGALQILRRGKRQALPPLAVSWWIEPTGAVPAQPGDFALMAWPSGSVALTEDRPAIVRFFHLHPEATPGRTFRLRIAQQDAPANTALDPVQDAIPWIIA